MMDAASFGQRIKEKYPDGVAKDGRRYADIDDVEIASMWVKAKPVYQGQVSFSDDEKIESLRGEAENAKQEADEAQMGYQDKTSIFPNPLKEIAEGQSEAGTERLKGAMKSVGQTMVGASALKAGPVGEAMLNEAPELKEKIGQIEQGFEPQNDYQRQGKTMTDIAQLAVVPERAGATKPAFDATKNVVEGIGKTVAKVLPEKDMWGQLDYAVRLAMPKLSPTEGSAAIASRNFKGPGIFSTAKATPTQRDNLVGESIADVVKKGNTLEQNVDAIGLKIAEINQGVRSMLLDAKGPYNKTPFNKAQLRSKLETGKSDLELVFASDPNVEKLYDKVSDAFIKQVESGDVVGLFDARQTFDKLPAVKKLLETEAKGENVRKEIVLAVRRAANEYVADMLPANNPYRRALIKESRMLEALGNIGDTNASILGKNKLQLWNEQFPILKWIGAGSAIGLTGGTAAQLSN